MATGAASHLLVTARSFDARAPFCRGTAGQCKLYLVGISHTQHAKVCVCMPKPVLSCLTGVYGHHVCMHTR